jgi:hypothetical protein
LEGLKFLGHVFHVQEKLKVLDLIEIYVGFVVENRVRMANGTRF